MTTEQIIVSVAIEGIILITLYVTTKSVNEKLKFIKKEMEYLEADVKSLHEAAFPSKGGTFGEKVASERRRVAKIDVPDVLRKAKGEGRVVREGERKA